MAINVQFVLRGESYFAVTHVHLPIILVVFIRPYDEFRAETGLVKCARGRTMNDHGAAA